MINDILSMEGDYKTNTLNISLKNVKKSILIDFANYYEKYVFRTFIYNHLVSNLSYLYY